MNLSCRGAECPPALPASMPRCLSQPERYLQHPNHDFVLPVVKERAGDLQPTRTCEDPNVLAAIAISGESAHVAAHGERTSRFDDAAAAFNSYPQSRRIRLTQSCVFTLTMYHVSSRDKTCSRLDGRADETTERGQILADSC